MIDVQAPYHFVPLSKWVYMPDWSHLVSHDIPLKDGYSGVIQYTLTNFTPLCVGGDKDQGNILRFSRDPEGNPVIPGSSLKGMIRSVLEIASFGKFNAVDNRKFSYRDISSNSAYLDKVIKKHKVIPGWIKYDTESGKWQFNKCCMAKIAHSTINDRLEVGVKNDDKESAISKYEQLPLMVDHYAIISEPKGTQKNRWVEDIYSPNTKEKNKLIKGNLIFVNKRIKGKGKPSDYEFSYFFYNPEQIISFDSIQEQVDNLFANHDEKQVSFLKKHCHPELGIPVFALVSSNKVHSFGLSKMPRVSYNYSTHDLIEQLNPAHLSHAYFDMAELMFGTLRDNALGLKSRITFADATLSRKEDNSNKVIYDEKRTILAAPKATFLGAYIEQSENQHYLSYDDKNAKLAGWKRYLVQQKCSIKPLENNNNKIVSQFELLPPNNHFSGKIIFHNLKKEELAALVWCLTLNNNPSHQHTLGHAKPFGAGAVQIKIIENESQIRSNTESNWSSLTTQHWVDIYNSHMSERFEPQGKWMTSPQLEYLMALTHKNISEENEFTYLELSKFKDIKNNKASLPALKYKEHVLKREQSSDEQYYSSVFCKGRLAPLFETNNTFHEKQRENIKSAQESATQRAEKVKLLEEKVKLREEKQAIIQNEWPPFERIMHAIQWLVNSQGQFHCKTEKDNNTKDFRNYIKEIKQLALTPIQRKQLIEQIIKINFCDKDVKRAISYLEKFE